MTAVWRGHGGSETLFPPHSLWGRVLDAGAISHGWRWREGSLAKGRLEWWTVGEKDQIFLLSFFIKVNVDLTQHLVSDPGMCVYSILELSPGESKHLLMSCPGCLPVAASLCASLYSVCSGSSATGRSWAVLSKVQEPFMLSFSRTVLKNVSQVVDALECTLYSSLSPIVSARITYFVLDPIYTVQR